MQLASRVQAWNREQNAREARFLMRVAESYPGAGSTWLTLLVVYLVFLGVAIGISGMVLATSVLWVSWFPWMAALFTFHFGVIGGIIVDLYPEAKGLRARYAGSEI